MGRPDTAIVFSQTPRGIPFQWDLTNYRSRGARDANTDVIHVIVSWELSEDFLQEAVGWTEWDGVSPTFNRITPLPDPWGRGLWCEDYDLVDIGAYPSRTEWFDPLNNNAPVNDWCRYALTFTRPRWFVRTNLTLLDFANLEHHRYCTVTEMPRPRERIVSGHGFQYLPPGLDAANDLNWVIVPDEREFIPDWQMEIMVTLVQVPISAPPYGAVLRCGGTVNEIPTQLVTSGKEWQAGELLFKGLGKPYEMYFGADNRPYFDLQYLFTVQPGPSSVPGFPGGWNTYLTRNAAGAKVYNPVRKRADKLPPYITTKFANLFRPGGT